MASVLEMLKNQFLHFDVVIQLIDELRSFGLFGVQCRRSHDCRFDFHFATELSEVEWGEREEKVLWICTVGSGQAGPNPPGRQSLRVGVFVSDFSE